MKPFTDGQIEHMHQMFKLVDSALDQMLIIVKRAEHSEEARVSIDVNNTFNIENEINNFRNQLKNQNLIDVDNRLYDYQTGVNYMDMIGECEKLGDYVVNVVEAHCNVNEKKAS